jgi:hypothetical protein
MTWSGYDTEMRSTLRKYFTFMTIVRVCELRRGDEFQEGQVVWKVIRIANGRIWLRRYGRNRPHRQRWVGEMESKGEWSMQFVYLLNRAYEQTSGVVGPDLAAEGGGDRPAADTEYVG